jgi:hypothetical protein
MPVSESQRAHSGVSPTFSLSGFASSSDQDLAAPHQAQGQPLERLLARRSCDHEYAELRQRDRERRHVEIRAIAAHQRELVADLLADVIAELGDDGAMCSHP